MVNVTQETFDKVAGAEGGEQLAPVTPVPCGFCDGDATVKYDGGARVVCTDCGATGPLIETERLAPIAIEAWNKGAHRA